MWIHWSMHYGCCGCAIRRSWLRLQCILILSERWYCILHFGYTGDKLIWGWIWKWSLQWLFLHWRFFSLSIWWWNLNWSSFNSHTQYWQLSSYLCIIGRNGQCNIWIRISQHTLYPLIWYLLRNKLKLCSVCNSGLKSLSK